MPCLTNKTLVWYTRFVFFQLLSLLLGIDPFRVNLNFFDISRTALRGRPRWHTFVTGRSWIFFYRVQKSLTKSENFGHLFSRSLLSRRGYSAKKIPHNMVTGRGRPIQISHPSYRVWGRSYPSPPPSHLPRIHAQSLHRLKYLFLILNLPWVTRLKIRLTLRIIHKVVYLRVFF